MNSLFQDGITVGWLMGESFIVDHARRSAIPEKLANALLHREKDVITPREYHEYTHFSDALMTDQEVVELPKVYGKNSKPAILPQTPDSKSKILKYILFESICTYLESVASFP